MIDRGQLHRDGYALLRGAIPAEWRDDLRAAFDAGTKPSDQWPVPRQASWRHSLVDLDSKVQADLVHAAGPNSTGARRRSILACYLAEPLYASHLETAKMRGVRMDTTGRFDPSELVRSKAP